MNEASSGFGERYARLMDVLSRCPKVQDFDQPDELEASTLAHAFLDLEESFRRFVNDQLPDLIRGELSESEICARLDDIGQEFRHIIYHIRDPRFYRHLIDNSES